MILFLDTETTGLPDFNKRARDPSQPHIVTLAALACHDDGTEIPELCKEFMVRPDGWTIPKEASDVHGITTEHALANGIPESEVAQWAVCQMRRASLVVAHNLQFDKFIVRVAARRFDIITDADDADWKAMPTFCTMKPLTNVCQLPGKYGYKWPKLSEAVRHCFGEELAKAHDALDDCRNAKRLYFWLKQKGLV